MEASTRLERLLLDHVRDANRRWNLFEPDDRVLVGVSGGKDSLALPRLLSLLPVGIELVHVGINIDEALLEYCRDIAPFHLVEVDVLAHLPKRENPCFECSRIRRKLILEKARERGIAKIALGHHRNDVVETLLLNMVFSREISTMMPKQSLFDGEYHIVRPLYTVPEALLASYAKERQYPVMDERCPHAGNSKRTTIRKMLRDLQHEHEKIDVLDNLFSSMARVNGDFLPDFARPDE